MEKPRNYVVFKDGHEEDILYSESFESDYHFGVCIFATKSGIYRRWPGTLAEPRAHYERVNPAFTDPTDEIKCVVINGDEKVSYGYEVDGNGVFIFGKVLAPPNSSDEEICKLIMKDLIIKYQKE